MSAVTGEAGTERTVTEALARGAVYRLLGGAFAYPTPPRLAEVAAAAATAAGRDEHAPAVRASLAELAHASAAADPDTVATEYVFLFDRQVRCPPYEGAWGVPQLAGKGAALADIAGFYRAFGLQPASVQHETEDHLVAELEFMSALAIKEAWALAEQDEEHAAITRQAQTAFVTDHLGRWAEAFADAVAEATPLPYYGAAAALLREWTRAEVSRLGATPAPVASRVADDVMQGDTLTCPMAPESDAGAETA
jgi:TorA maturation chaperone TorD